MTRDLYKKKYQEDINKRHLGTIPTIVIKQNEKVKMILDEKKLHKALRKNRYSKEPKHRRR